MIRYVHGNLLESDEKIIIHGCNTQGEQNSGIAKSIRDLYPSAHEGYKRHYDAFGLKLGEIVWTEVENGPIIGHGITQRYYGRENIRYCSYDAIDMVFASLNTMMEGIDVPTVGLPLIGCGLANGSWSIISSIINTHSKNFEPVVYLLDGVIPSS